MERNKKGPVKLAESDLNLLAALTSGYCCSHEQ